MNMPYTMPIKLHSFQIIAENLTVNFLKMSSNVVYGYYRSKSGSVTGKEIIVKVSFSV